VEDLTPFLRSHLAQAIKTDATGHGLDQRAVALEHADPVVERDRAGEAATGVRSLVLRVVVGGGSWRERRRGEAGIRS
jgi:hypothetical protein